MAMTQAELDERARERAISERIHTFKIAGQPVYMVRSRNTEPGAMHQVRVLGGAVQHCTCKGWYYRQSCTHAQAVTRRLERESKRRPAQDSGIVENAPMRKDQIFRAAC
jgi:hypothetical protein